MQPFRFIQCGDLHLGAPFQYLSAISKTVDQVVTSATYCSFEAIIDLAIAERVQAFLITGDVYNSGDHNLEAQVRFVRAMDRLYDARIPVYMVHGNHDPAESWRAQIDMPSNVHIFSDTMVERVPLIVNGLEIGGLYGMSCSNENRDKNISTMYNALSTDDFSIALMHGTVGSSNEVYMPKQIVGPCNLDDLSEGAMNYWAIGHIHKAQVLSEDPYVVYAGNSQGLHKKERGPKGCYLVTVSSNGHCQVEFKETCSLRFEEAHIDISYLETEAHIMEMIRHKKDMLRNNLKRPVLLEIILTGTGSLHRLCSDESVRQLWLTDSQDEDKGRANFVLPYRIVDQTKPTVDLVERRRLTDMVGDYLAAYDREIGGQPIDTIREILEERPEFKRLGRYAYLLSNEMLLDAANRAEVDGAMKLVGASNED